MGLVGGVIGRLGGGTREEFWRCGSAAGRRGRLSPVRAGWARDSCCTRPRDAASGGRRRINLEGDARACGTGERWMDGVRTRCERAILSGRMFISASTNPSPPTPSPSTTTTTTTTTAHTQAQARSSRSSRRIPPTTTTITTTLIALIPAHASPPHHHHHVYPPSTTITLHLAPPSLPLLDVGLSRLPPLPNHRREIYPGISAHPLKHTRFFLLPL